MLLLAFRSFFFIAVILAYSTGIWRLINDYFRREFQSYLEVESQSNQYLLRDPPKQGPSGMLPPDVPDNQLPVGGGSVQDGAHQQVTDSITALLEASLTTGTDANFAGTVRGDRRQEPPEVATGREGKKGVPVTRTVVAAAEVPDIRSRTGKQPLSEERKGDDGEKEGQEEEEEENKWIAYWRAREGRADPPVDDNANAYCTVVTRRTYQETFAGAVTGIREQQTADGDAFGCD